MRTKKNMSNQYCCENVVYVTLLNKLRLHAFSLIINKKVNSALS
jgi:hypothetical protein